MQIYHDVLAILWMFLTADGSRKLRHQQLREITDYEIKNVRPQVLKFEVCLVYICLHFGVCFKFLYVAFTI